MIIQPIRLTAAYWPQKKPEGSTAAEMKSPYSVNNFPCLVWDKIEDENVPDREEGVEGDVTGHFYSLPEMEFPGFIKVVDK